MAEVGLLASLRKPVFTRGRSVPFPALEPVGNGRAANLETQQAEPLPEICPVSVKQFALETGLHDSVGTYSG